MAVCASRTRVLLVLFPVAASLMLPLSLTGCKRDRQEDRTDLAGESAPVGEEAATQLASRRPVAPEPVDDRDAPDSPAALPRSASVGDWVKVRPIEVASGSAVWGALSDTRRAARLSCFHVQRVARCGYQRRDDERGRIAEVEFFETSSPEDALGMLLTECPGPDRSSAQGPIGIIRTRDDGTKRHWHAWQGYHYIHVSMRLGVGDESIPAVERLLGRILLATPGTPMPELPALLPEQGRLDGQFWVVRSVRSLTGPAGPPLDWSDPSDVDAHLGLGNGAVLALAAYETTESEEPNYVFVIRYASADEARVAYDRCSAGQAAFRPACLLTDPVGPFLAGSWTPESESLAHTLPELRRRLLGLGERAESG